MKKKEIKFKDWRDEWEYKCLNSLPENIQESHLFIAAAVITQLKKLFRKSY